MISVKSAGFHLPGSKRAASTIICKDFVRSAESLPGSPFAKKSKMSGILMYGTVKNWTNFSASDGDNTWPNVGNSLLSRCKISSSVRTDTCFPLYEVEKKKTTSFVWVKQRHILKQNRAWITHRLLKNLSPHEFTTVVASAADKRDRTALCLLLKRDRKPLNCDSEEASWTGSQSWLSPPLHCLQRYFGSLPHSTQEIWFFNDALAYWLQREYQWKQVGVRRD